MAALRGDGAMTNINLIVKAYDKGVTKNGKTRFADVLVDHRDPERGKQLNAHLTSRRQEVDGKTVYNNSAAYTAEQFDKITSAAGPNAEPVRNVKGEAIGQAYAVKASVMPAKDGLIINTNKEIGQSDFKIDENTLDSLYTSMKEVKESQAATETAAPQAEAPQAAAEATAPQAAEPQPSVG